MNSQYNENRPLIRQYLGIFFAAVPTTLLLHANG